MPTRQEYAKLSMDAYNDSGSVTGWSTIREPTAQQRSSGFFARAYRNGSEIVIAFRGTEGLEDGRDLAADKQIVDAAAGFG